MTTLEEKEYIGLYHEKFVTAELRRTPLIRIAEIFFKSQDYARTVCYAQAALSIPECEEEPIEDVYFTAHVHELLYESYAKLGAHQSAAQHFQMALDYDPMNPKYLHDLRYYSRLPKVSFLVEDLESNPVRNINYPDGDSLSYAMHVPGVPEVEEMQSAPGEWVAYLPGNVKLESDAVIIAYVTARANAKNFVYFNTGDESPKAFMMQKSLLKKLEKVPFESWHDTVAALGESIVCARALTNVSM